MDSAQAARESARQQEAQIALLSLEHFFIDCQKVHSVEFAWESAGTGRTGLLSNALGVDGESLDPKSCGSERAYARAQAGNLAIAWPEGEARIALTARRERPFDAVGPILLGEDLFGAWMAEREAREMSKALPASKKARSRRPL